MNQIKQSFTVASSNRQMIRIICDNKQTGIVEYIEQKREYVIAVTGPSGHAFQPQVEVGWKDAMAKLCNSLNVDDSGLPENAIYQWFAASPNFNQKR